MLLQQVEWRAEHTFRNPTVHPDADPVPLAEAFQQDTPLTVVLQDMEDRVDDVEAGNPHVPAMNRIARTDYGVLFFCKSNHDREMLISYVCHNKHLAQIRTER